MNTPPIAPALTHKQRMLSGQLYRGDDPELQRDYTRAQQLLSLVNVISASNAFDPQRDAIFALLLGLLGERATIRPPFRCDYGIHISVGADTFINYDAVFLDCAPITIGREVQIAPRVQLYTATHPLDAAIRRAGLESALPITIADGVWLGGGTIVCPGVTIGENTVIGAGSVVTRSLPANVLAVGNPCRVLRPLEPSELRSGLD